MLSGDWNRLLNRLLCENLDYEGQKNNFKVPGELAKAINERKLTCQKEGVDLGKAYWPEKALTYNPLIADLEKHGVLNSEIFNFPSDTVNSQSIDTNTDEENKLIHEHKTKVCIDSGLDTYIFLLRYSVI